MFDRLPWKREAFWTALPESEVRARLVEVFDRGDVDEDGSFQVHVGGRNRNSWRPRIVGDLVSASGGTFIEVRYVLHPAVFLFTLVHGVFLLGISWLIGWGAYLAGAHEVRGTFEAQLDIACSGDEARAKIAEHPLADPTSAGAAAGAPALLRARASLDEATFHLGSTAIRVDVGGLAWQGVEVPWDELTFVGSEPGTLVLGCGEQQHRIPVPTLITEQDLAWLVTYLIARNERWSTPEDRRRAVDRARAQLQGLRS